MSSLLTIAHGSRRAASNDEVRQLADAVRAQPGQAYAHVETAFLELAEPSIPDGLVALVGKGATEIVAFPYFLAAGTHVAQDIPDAIAEFTAKHPEVAVRLTQHLGASAVLPAAILNVAG
ncbi:MAG: CbiX/SirB N-terminal domain-containing protein [Thiobacillus sp.]|nr:CbiX/SirB N-terminal domain-containing protein [Thiobacillus sp.]MDP2057053.1 CbiX/SirB N-terminal domain-containing protein [Thiobacillus sp.]